MDDQSAPSTRKRGLASLAIDAGLACAALLLGVLLIRREFFADSTPRAQSTAPILVEAVRSTPGNGSWIGDSTAPVKITVFNDLECPFCAQFHRTLESVQRTNAGRVAIHFVHFPLPSHRFARSAAIGAECAKLSGKFDAFVSLVFSKQDSLGIKPWTRFASDAGIADTSAFVQCTSKSPTQFVAIEEGVKWGKKLNLNVTPSVFINGWQYSIPPDEVGLQELIRDFSEGKAPSK